MQTVLQFAANAATTVGQAAQGAAGSSGLLAGLRVGTSAISAFSTYAEGRQKADQLRFQAGLDTVQASQELTQAQETATQIQRAYNSTVADQMAAASAMGIDVGSGSVVEARQRAQQEADRQTQITWNGALMNSSLRRARASYLNATADQTQALGAFAASGKLLMGSLDALAIGGPKKGK